MRRLMNSFNEQGYTFIESIFQLIIMAIFVHLFLLFFFWKTPIDNNMPRCHLLIGNCLLLIYSSFYLMSNVLEVYPIGRGITLNKRKRLIDIEQGTGVIRKRVDGQGHIPLLTDVREAIYFLMVRL